MELNNAHTPAGFGKSEREIYYKDGEASTIQAGTHLRNINLPSWAVIEIRETIYNNQSARKLLSSGYGISTEEGQIQQWTVCNLGGYDNKPDIDDEKKVINREYWECGHRGKCELEKTGWCFHPANLSYREIEVLKLIANGLLDKEIADKLYLSTNTVVVHKANILKKTDCHNKSELTKWAIHNNIIQA